VKSLIGRMEEILIISKMLPTNTFLPWR